MLRNFKNSNSIGNVQFSAKIGGHGLRTTEIILVHNKIPMSN